MWFLSLILIMSVVVFACSNFASKEITKINVICYNYLFMVKISLLCYGLFLFGYNTYFGNEITTSLNVSLRYIDSINILSSLIFKKCRGWYEWTKTDKTAKLFYLSNSFSHIKFYLDENKLCFRWRWQTVSFEFSMFRSILCSLKYRLEAKRSFLRHIITSSFL